MTARITIVTPEFPPMRGGLADYTAKVIEHWPVAQDIDVVVPDSGKWTTKNSAVLVQYSAYGFHRFGYPRRLIDDLVNWKQKTGGHLCVMFHEIWTFWPWWNKNFAVQWLHRRAIAKLIRAADGVFTSTVSQADHLSALSGKEVGVLPVGANILPKDSSPQQTQTGTAVLFGMAGTRLRALREMGADLAALAAQGRLTRVITIGGGDGAKTERKMLESLRLSAGFEQLGDQPAAKVSELFACAEFGIATQDPLSYTKSGTFMAYAAHGLNILSPHANPAAAAPSCWLTSPAELAVRSDAADLRARAGKLREWSEQTATWPKIAQKFAAALHPTT